MTKQVPESQTLNRDQQLERLRRRLLGNDAFALCRGKLGVSVADLMGQIRKEAKTGSKSHQRWDKISSAMRVMHDLLGQYERGGMNEAFAELHRALTDSRHLLPGETIPVERTEPFTLFMMDPGSTIPLIEWIIKYTWNQRDNRGKNHSDECARLLGLVVDTFRDGNYGEDHWCSFCSLSGLSREYRYYLRQHSLKRRKGVRQSRRGMKIVPIRLGRLQMSSGESYRTNNEVCDAEFARLHRMEQNEVLALYERESLDRIGTWQLQLPKAAEKLWVGMHPEKEHARWHREFGNFASPGVSHGWGAVVLTADPVSDAMNERYVRYPTYVKCQPPPDGGFRFVFNLTRKKLG